MDDGAFYIGREVAEEGGGDPLLYEADDLVTHGVIVGMTGSGKTGLGIDLLEEALVEQIPCLIIDPKGDMGNLHLIFPDLQPSDFAPWVDPAEAEREGVSVEDLAASTAETWAEGLAGWDVTPERMRRVTETARPVIYTPGSSAGTPLNILGSLAAPPLSWDEHAEDMRDEIEGFVSSLLVLADIEADPVSSPPHILLSTIIEHEWRAGRDLDLATLVGMLPDPPVRKLGVFQLDEFYPKDDRTSLAMQLNGLLASPSFAGWLEGDPLDIGRLLDGGDRTAAPIIYLAHLSESERQFVVTLLLAKLVSWMRRQPGTGKLRALVYMDEVFGFAPPVAEPPSKKQILTILKQARAYGVGMVLATQNPVDLDYKTMSNAGAWMIGRLQTENDKKRILEGLADAGGSTDVTAVDQLVSNLDKRQFVLRQAGKTEPVVFGTRWAMSYLAGPLDRTAVKRLSEPRPSVPPSVAEPASDAEPPEEGDAAPLDDPDSVPVMPSVAEDVEVVVLDPAAAWADEVAATPQPRRWRPAAVATVDLLYDDHHADVEHREEYEAVIDPLTRSLDPAAVLAVDHDERDFRDVKPEDGPFVIPDAPVGQASFWKDLSRQLVEHLVAERSITVWKNADLKMYSRVGESREEFLARCSEAAEEHSDENVAALEKKYATRIDRAKAALRKADRRVTELEADVQARQQQEVMSGVGDLLGSLLGGRSRSGALRRAANRRSQSQRTGADLESALGRVDDEQRELAELEIELENELVALVEEWEQKAENLEEIEIPLEKSDVQVSALRLVWIPSDS